MNIMKYKTKLLFISIALLILFSRQVSATKLIISPASGQYKVGDLIEIEVRTDTEGKDINAIDLTVLVPKLFEVKGVSKAGSSINIWVQEPSFTQDGAFFSGGFIGGIKLSDVLIGTIIIEAKAIGKADIIAASSSVVVMNDGQGSFESLFMPENLFTIIPGKSVQGKAESSAHSKLSST